MALFGCNERQVAKDGRMKWFNPLRVVVSSNLHVSTGNKTTVGTRGYYLVVPVYDANTPTRSLAMQE